MGARALSVFPRPAAGMMRAVAREGMTEGRWIQARPAALLAELLARGLLIDSGAPGVYGHGPAFEAVRRRLEARLSALAAEHGAEPLRFPPVLPRRELERSGYLGLFPHLAGSVYAFEGSDEDAVLQGRRAERHEDWGAFQRMTDLALVPAACYPVYPALAARGRLGPAGAFVDAGGAWVFRNEPSDDPARRQAFHQHELVRAGEPEPVRAWRDEWAERGLALLRSLGLEVTLQPASDPFFGPRGRMLASSQRQRAMKLELVARIAGPDPAALASFNHHAEHFGLAFGLQLADGSVAHSACVGFGHERIVLALLTAHGFDPAEWPAEVRAQLWS